MLLAQPTATESLLLSYLLAGDEEPFITMRAQLALGWVVARTESPEGVIVDFEIPDSAPRLVPPRLDFGDVEFRLADTGGGGFAIIRAEHGVLAFLQILSDEKAWRPGTPISDVTYSRLIVSPTDDSDYRFESVAERDWDEIRRTVEQLAGFREDDEDDEGEPGTDDEEIGDAELAEFAVELVAHPEQSIALPLLLPLSAALRAAFPGDEDDGGADGEDPDRPESVVEMARTGMALLLDLPELIHRHIAAEWTGAHVEGLPVQTLARMWKSWARQEQPAPVIAAVAAALLVSDRAPGLLGPASRPLARELFHYVRQSGIRTWAEAEAHAHAWWESGEGGAVVWPLVVRSFSDRLGAAQRVLEQLMAAPPPPPAPAPRGPSMQLLQLQVPPGEYDDEEMERLREELAAARGEAERFRIDGQQLRLTRKQLQARVKTLEGELAPLRSESERLQRYANALAWRLVEEREAAAAGHPDPIPDPPAEGWQGDLLSGRTIILCTGQDRAGARAAMADELRQAGAEVMVHDANGKGMPDRFPADALVVCDVRFLSHASAGRVRMAAERGGARVLEVRAGQGGIVRAVESSL
jgi:hypothetical protein